MGDTLRYKFPGSEVASSKGSFSSVNDFRGFSGFVISDFTGKQKYAFHVKDEEEELHYFSRQPDGIAKPTYLELAESYVETLQAGELDKVILARQLILEKNIDPNVLFEKLCEAYPQAFVYLASSKLFGTWIGASPEVLLSSQDEKKFVMALAGTRAAESKEDWTEKEYREHEYVVDFINERIQSLNISHLQVEERQESSAGPVKHLRTNIEFSTAVEDCVIAELMHPTPAVAGIPQEKAIEYIQQNENMDRGLYTGYIGVIDSGSKLFVNLRCMQVFEDSMSIYVGGGLTKESVPEEEWEETQNKAKTLLQIVDLM